MTRILDALFRREEINGGERCPTYLYRWTIFQPRWPRWLWKGFGIYLHRFVGDDWSRDLHDHPKRFISIGLKGGYRETTPRIRHPFVPGYGDKKKCGWITEGAQWVAHDPYYCRKTEAEHFTVTVYRAPWLRSFPATHIHRLNLIDGQPCWTLVIVLRHVREWGFWHLGRWIPWRKYVDSSMADDSKACP